MLKFLRDACCSDNFVRSLRKKYIYKIQEKPERTQRRKLVFRKFCRFCKTSGPSPKGLLSA